MRTIEVVPYQKEWKELFETEHEKLKQIFGEEALNIYHIGSTSIEHIKAKPIIDILIEVHHINKVDAYNEQMEALGYEAKGEHGIVDRRFFQKGGNQRTHHVHVFQTGNPEIDRHLAFCDYLRAHPEEAEQYSDLKEQLAETYRHTPDDYTNAKTKFIRAIDEKAKLWMKTKMK